MEHSNIHFHNFIQHLESALGFVIEQKRLTIGCYQIYAENLPFIIFYYNNTITRRLLPHSEKRHIHIDEDTWVNKPDVLIKRITVLSGKGIRIHARDCIAVRIDKRTAMDFMTEHHLHAALPGKFRYGLFLDGELMSIAVYSGGRKMNQKPEHYRSFELLRFCHKKGYIIVGGLGKLLKIFQQSVNAGDIMTYIDKDWADGKNYEKTGFTRVGETEPHLFWIHLQTMIRFTTISLPIDLINASRDEIREAGYLPKYNNGSLKLIKTYSE